MNGLQGGDLRLRLFDPGTFYRGTRFDWAGVFDTIEYRGADLAGRWFECYDPLMHDAVCGPSEEFTPIGYGEGETFLKVGVGRLKADGNPYDRFKLYSVADAGKRSMETTSDAIVFHHEMPEYAYEKTVCLLSDRSFAIRHRLEASTLLEGELYNHNFFTMGKMAVTPSRLIDFPFSPQGDWRAAYDSVGFTSGGIRFFRALQEGESVYTGNIHRAGEEGMPYEMTLREGNLSVSVKGDVPVFKTVLWANHRIACLEPYNRIDLAPGESIRWKIEYTLI